MSAPQHAIDVKLIASIFFRCRELLSSVLEKLTEKYGVVDFISPVMPFSYTDYYLREMGSHLERVFVAFLTLIKPEEWGKHESFISSFMLTSEYKWKKI